MSFKGLFVQYSDEEFKCPDGDCGVESKLYVRCPACEGISASNCFHDLDSLAVHFSHYHDEESHDVLNPFKEITLGQLYETLETTIKRDQVSKGITFLGMLNAQTAEDPFNMMFAASSSTGKSYIPLELAEYFPASDIVRYSGASPTSFFHENGARVIETADGYEPAEAYIAPLREEIEAARVSKNKQKIKELERQIAEILSGAKILVDLKGKILIFLDQPNAQLLVKIRSFLSHDMEVIEIPITDKAGHGGNRTKHVLLRGAASVIFCTANQAFDDQEGNRNFILSPESDLTKIEEALKLLDSKLSDRNKFRNMLEKDPKRRALIFRIELTRASGVKRIVIEPGVILKRFQDIHKFPQSRAPRDFTRLYALTYGHALLNLFNREHEDESTIRADVAIDVDAAFGLYQNIMVSNESGVSPETYAIHENIFAPAYVQKNERAESWQGLSYSEACLAYLQIEHRPLSYEKVKAIMRSLVYAGLMREDQDANDKRKMLFTPTPEILTKQAVAQGGLPYSFQDAGR